MKSFLSLYLQHQSGPVEYIEFAEESREMAHFIG